MIASIGGGYHVGSGAQGLDSAGGVVEEVAEAFVVEGPSVDALHNGADGFEPGAMFDPIVSDRGLKPSRKQSRRLSALS
jgi:hypothetical protein